MLDGSNKSIDIQLDILEKILRQNDKLIRILEILEE